MTKNGKNTVLFAGDRLFLKFPALDYFKDRLSEVDGELISTEGMDAGEFISAARDAAAVVLIARELNRQIIESMNNCRLIMTLSVGYDCVDVGAATEKGIPVSNSPTYCSDDVANHAMTLLLACTRKLHRCLDETASGGWDYKVGKPMYNYTGKKLGIIGLGKIGRAILPKARGFGMEAAAYDPYIADDIFDLLGVERKYELPDLLRDADYVTIHVPLTGETRHMINRETLSMMKSRAVLINTARGAIIEEDDLADALKRGVIDGAGIDVLEKEPPRKDHPLVSSRETVVTPHVAWYSEESFEKNKILGMDELVRVLKGRRPRYIVNPQVFCCG